MNFHDKYGKCRWEFGLIWPNVILDSACYYAHSHLQKNSCTRKTRNMFREFGEA